MYLLRAYSTLVQANSAKTIARRSKSEECELNGVVCLPGHPGGDMGIVSLIGGLCI